MARCPPRSSLCARWARASWNELLEKETDQAERRDQAKGSEEHWRVSFEACVEHLGWRRRYQIVARSAYGCKT